MGLRAAFPSEAPPYSTDYTTAFVEMREFLRVRYYSGRERFWKALSRQFKAETDGRNLIAWPHALGYLEPVHVARAMLVTALEERLANVPRVPQ
jgi:hypothetical protein